MATQLETRLLQADWEEVSDLRDAFMAVRTNIPRSIRERWVNRIEHNGWHLNERAGARSYLRRYGNNIGPLKVIHLARMAEERGYPRFALEMWTAAHQLLNPGRLRRRMERNAQRAARARNRFGDDAVTHEAERAAREIEERLAQAVVPQTAEDFYDDLADGQEFV